MNLSRKLARKSSLQSWIAIFNQTCRSHQPAILSISKGDVMKYEEFEYTRSCPECHGDGCAYCDGAGNITKSIYVPAELSYEQEDLICEGGRDEK